MPRQKEGKKDARKQVSKLRRTLLAEWWASQRKRKTLRLLNAKDLNASPGTPWVNSACAHCPGFQGFHSLSKENQVSLVRTFLSAPGSECKISRLGGWGWKNDPDFLKETATAFSSWFWNF